MRARHALICVDGLFLLIQITAMSNETIHVNTPFQHSLVMGLQAIDADVAFASINSEGTPGALNTQVLIGLGYNEKQRPTRKDLMKGFHYLSQEKLKPIVFIVTIDDESTADRLLTNNLTKALYQLQSYLMGKTLWIPLMGTGASGAKLSFDVSYRATVDALANSPVARESKGRRASSCLTFPRLSN